MRISTRLVFKTLLRRLRADCVCDIGACDGSESLVFRQVLPQALLLTFEPNPRLFKRIAADSRFAQNRIEVFPYALTNTNGAAPFHVPDLNYDDPAVFNPGIGSLLPLYETQVKEVVEVPARRLDDLLLTKYPSAQRIGLWIDAEGAEHQILEGIAGIKEKVVALHVEVAFVPMHPGHRLYLEVEQLLKSYGFVPICKSTSSDGRWGDVVFAPGDKVRDLGWRFGLNTRIAKWLCQFRVDTLGWILKERCYWLYRPMYRAYVRLFT